MVTVIAHGRDGVALNYRDDQGIDHRRVGIDARAWAVLALHEAAHCAHHLMVGLGATADALSHPAREPGQELDGFREFVRLVHRGMTGERLPDAFDAARWPKGAPGMGGWLARIAEAVSEFAVPPAPQVRPFDDARWLAAQAASWSVDLRNMLAEREAAAAWRAEFEGAAS
jgi:hypothetical protein